jgi:hypothetical protein
MNSVFISRQGGYTLFRLKSIYTLFRIKSIYTLFRLMERTGCPGLAFQTWEF